MEPDPRHQRVLDALVCLDASEIKRRVGVADYRDCEYIANEVLVSLIRARFGKENGVLDFATRTLFDRLTRLVKSYFYKNKQWYGVVRSSSETLSETVSYVWLKLLVDKSKTSLAELRFLTFVEQRVKEWLRSQLSLKNQAKSLDALSDSGPEAKERLFAKFMDEDETGLPEVAAIKAQSSEALNRELLTLKPPERHAVYFRVQCEFDWDLTAKYLGCSVTTAKKHLQSALEKLRGVKV